MMLSMAFRVSLVLAVIVGGILTASLTRAETPAGSNVDTRVIVSLQVRPEALQQWISGAWQVNPVAAGPSKGANASVVFVDQQLWLDADGKPMATGINRIMALTVPGKHGGTGETESVVGRIYSAEPSYVPSPYKNAVSATIRRERMIKEPNLEPASGRELWTVRAAGGTAELQFDYQGGLPSRSKGEAKVYSGAEPTFFRIYRWEQGADVVKSVPDGIDRVQNFKLSVAIPELAKIFDGSERVVSVTMLPWYLRQVSLP